MTKNWLLNYFFTTFPLRHSIQPHNNLQNQIVWVLYYLSPSKLYNTVKSQISHNSHGDQTFHSFSCQLYTSKHHQTQTHNKRRPFWGAYLWISTNSQLKQVLKKCEMQGSQWRHGSFNRPKLHTKDTYVCMSIMYIKQPVTSWCRWMRAMVNGLMCLFSSWSWEEQVHITNSATKIHSQLCLAMVTHITIKCLLGLTKHLLPTKKKKES